MNKAEIMKRLEKIKEERFCWCLEEFSEGINSIASPILAENGNVGGALHVHGPSYRFPSDSMKNIVSDLLVAQAEKMSKELKYK